jgi:hypothetical protein
MKVTALILSLLSALGSASAQCATSSAEVVCTMDSAPVKCGFDACEYGNQCAANAAGYAPSRCYPAGETCPTADENTACTFESNPVVCGVSGCQYSNYCLAQAAGFPPTFCFSENCPAPDDGVACTLEFEPFICFVDGVGTCQYSNSCLAAASGIDIPSQCFNDFFIPGNPEGCGLVATGTACEFEFAPLVCNGECFYTNSCEAEAAGLTPSDPDVCQSANCPTADGLTICTADFNPVTCQGCQYANQCLATAAGFLEDACNPSGCPTPNATVACQRNYNPVTCDSDGVSCVYDNLCIGEAAGLGESCAEVETPANPESCPVDDGTSACTFDINEVICGADGCSYANLCLAEAAGFTVVDCSAAVCPKPVALEDGSLGTCADDEMVCGPNACPYLNGCLAQSAGWKMAECAKVDCPQPPEATACVLNYAPIVCFDLNVFEVPCSYPNSCLAEASGFDTSPFAGICVQPSIGYMPITPFGIDPNATATDATPEDTPTTEETPAAGEPSTPGATAETAAPGAPAETSGPGTSAPAPSPASDAAMLVAKESFVSLLVAALFML